MGVVLEYAGGPKDIRRATIPPSLMTILLTYAHINICWQANKAMLIWACSHATDQFVAWTPIAWLPGCALMRWAGQGAGLAVMLLISVISAHVVLQVLTRYRDGVAGGWRALVRDQQVWLAALLWFGWVPVPALYSFVYQFGEWATKLH